MFSHFLQWILYRFSFSSRQYELFIDGQEKFLHSADETRRQHVLESLHRLHERVMVLQQAKQISSISLESAEKLNALKTFDDAGGAWHDVCDPKHGQACYID